MARGRSRDEDAERRILAAAFELVASEGPGTVTINAIAANADVAKQTIYRWWPSRTAVILDALVQGTIKDTPFRESEDVRADFDRHLRSVIKLFNSPTGRVIRELLAESQTDDRIAGEFRARFWAPRRAISKQRLERAASLGVVRSDIDTELVLDTIYGALWVRLVVDHIPMRPIDATRILDVVWNGIDRTGDRSD